MIDFLRDDNFLNDGDKALHGFFGRRGGVSTGLFGSLNCGLGSGDDLIHVRQNRASVAAALGLRSTQLLTAHQVHSADCVFVDKAWAEDQRPQADAMVTDVPGIMLGILTADCGPVLFYGEKENGAPIIGAAHAGWKGAIGGILDATVKRLVEKGTLLNSIRAGIGPCIGPKSYEVGPDFIAPFLNDNPEIEHFFKSARRDERLMFDLAGFIAFRLSGLGVRQVSIMGQDTYAQESDYFSYRRATHRGESVYGRQISALVIPGQEFYSPLISIEPDP